MRDAAPAGAPGRPHGRPHPDRARQFMPFAALKGYYDLVREQERVREPRREMTQEHAEELSAKVAGLARGTLVTATYYDADHYERVTGLVARVEPELRTLQVVKTRIGFDDLWDVEEQV